MIKNSTELEVNILYSCSNVLQTLEQNKNVVNNNAKSINFVVQQRFQEFKLD